MSAKNIARRREILWHRDPHCHWCGRLTQLLSGKEGERMRRIFPDDMATVDHLDTKLSGRRSPGGGHEERTVLACRVCNEKRAADEERNVGLAEIQRRSGRLPLAQAAS